MHLNFGHFGQGELSEIKVRPKFYNDHIEGGPRFFSTLCQPIARWVVGRFYSQRVIVKNVLLELNQKCFTWITTPRNKWIPYHNSNSTDFSSGRKNCYRTFETFESWVQHLRRAHQTEEECLRQETNQPGASKSAEKLTCEFAHESFHRVDHSDCADDVETLNFESIRNASVRLISKIRASSSAIVSLCEDAVVECNYVVCSNHELLRHGYQSEAKPGPVCWDEFSAWFSWTKY